MPLNSRGSVSARLSVWFSERSRAEKVSTLAARTPIPPRPTARRAAAPPPRGCAAPPPRVEARGPRRALDQRERGPAPGARRGQDQRPVREIEPRLGDAARPLRPAHEPAEPAGNHEVDGEKELVAQVEHDPLADAF